jgi:hypothetical protein
MTEARASEHPALERIAWVGEAGPVGMPHRNEAVDERFVLGRPRRLDGGELGLPRLEGAGTGDRRDHELVGPKPVERGRT